MGKQKFIKSGKGGKGSKMDQPEKIETGLKLENNSNVQKKRPKSKKINKANNKARYY